MGGGGGGNTKFCVGKTEKDTVCVLCARARKNAYALACIEEQNDQTMLCHT